MSGKLKPRSDRIPSTAGPPPRRSWPRHPLGLLARGPLTVLAASFLLLGCSHGSYLYQREKKIKSPYFFYLGLLVLVAAYCSPWALRGWTQPASLGPATARDHGGGCGPAAPAGPPSGGEARVGRGDPDRERPRGASLGVARPPGRARTPLGPGWYGPARRQPAAARPEERARAAAPQDTHGPLPGRAVVRPSLPPSSRGALGVSRPVPALPRRLRGGG